MFNSHKPTITDPKSVLLARIAGHLGFGLGAFCVVYAFSFFGLLNGRGLERNEHGVYLNDNYALMEKIVGHPVNHEEALQYIWNVSLISGIVVAILPTTMIPYIAQSLYSSTRRRRRY